MTAFCIGINLLILLDGQIVEHLGGKEKNNAKKFKKGVPKKVLQYFSLIPKLKKFF